jgi:regulatory protein
LTLGLRARAIALLARREHAREELRRKLAAHAVADDDVEAVLDQLEREGLLSDARYSEQMALRHRGRHGALRLRQKLRGSGVSDTAMAPVVEAARAEEPAQVLVVLRRKFPLPPGDRVEWARQARYLQNRGFGPEVIRQALRAPSDVEPDALEESVP